MSEYDEPNEIQIWCTCGCNELDIETHCDNTTITCTRCGRTAILKDGRY